MRQRDSRAECVFLLAEQSYLLHKVGGNSHTCAWPFGSLAPSLGLVSPLEEDQAAEGL